MKKIDYFILFVTFGLCGNAQDFQWAKGEGLWAYDYGYGVTTDNNGNVYVAGKFEEAAKFSGVTLSCFGNHDAFLARYSPSGTMDWIRTAGGPLGDYAEAIYTDKSNYVYISGEIEGYNTTINFPPGNVSLNCVGDNDAFFAKYDLSGNLIFAKKEGAINSEKALGITSDNVGNIYIAGYFDQSTNFNGQSYNSNGGKDIFIAKYDKDGNFQWFRNAGSPGRDEAKFIKCDAQGNPYICGIMSNGCKFGDQTLNTFHNTAYYDAFIAKYNGSGDLLWVKSGGGDVDDIAWSMTMTNEGLIYIGGEFSAYAEFGGKSVMSSGMLDVLIACYDQNGNCVWVNHAGGPLVDRARAIGTDGTYLFITGQFGGTGNFGWFPQSTPEQDSSDVFISCFDKGGSFIWVNKIDGPRDSYEGLGYESGNAICAEASGNIYVTGGMLADTLKPNDYNKFGGVTVPAYRRTDVFVAKMTWNPGTVTIKENTGASPGMLVYPNPANGYVMVKTQSPSEVCLFDCLGRTLARKNLSAGESGTIDLSPYSDGVYILKTTQPGGTDTEQRIILTH
jgi:hypothetical protein